MRHRSGFSAGLSARACRLDMAASGFWGWNTLAADVKVQSLITAALPPVFRSFVAGKGSLAPASPRREASLYTCPRGFSRGQFFLRVTKFTVVLLLALSLGLRAGQLRLSRLIHAARMLRGRPCVGTLSISRQSPVQHGGRGGGDAVLLKIGDDGRIQFVQLHPKGTPARPAPAVPASARPARRCGRTCRRASDGRAPATRPGQRDRDSAWRE